MNIRQAITRNITYSEVTVSFEGESQTYIVYGVTTPTKEMKRVLKDYKGNDVPVITVHTVTEKRAISLENFINNSIIINESEEK